MKIVITGGHLSPALSIIDEIGKKAEIVFVGRKYSNDFERSLSLEFQEISKRKIPFYHLPAGRLTRILSFQSIINFLKTPLGFFAAYRILKKEKPKAILAFGGYIALPICITASFLQIPIYIHEQTISPGLTNRLLAKLARKIFVSFAQSMKFFPKEKIILAGNPLRKSTTTIIKRPFVIKKNLPVIYFTGGSLGSHSINLIIEKLLPQLLKKYQVIHQTGNIKEYQDYQRLLNLQKKLPQNLKKHYYLCQHFFDEEIGYIYQTCDLVVGRAGANTIFELIYLKKPAILIPLPWSANNEQFKQALFLKNAGVAEIFDQSDNPQKLFLFIDQVIKNIKIYQENFKNLVEIIKPNAAKIIAQTIAS